jgi:hypothetical protein
MTTPTTDMMSIWKNISPRAKIFLSIAFGVAAAGELSIYALAMRGGDRETQQQAAATDSTHSGRLEQAPGEHRDQ